MRIAIVGLLHVEFICFRVHFMYKSFVELSLFDLWLYLFLLFEVSGSAYAEC